MTRNVVLGKINDPADAAAQAQLDAGVAGIAALDLPGQAAVHIGRDAGLREGGWTFAITNDWVDADGCRTYDLDEEHNRYRAMIVAVLRDVARVQFEIDLSPASPQ
jgi:hypothetical protein